MENVEVDPNSETMGNINYRISPIKTFHSLSGRSTFFDFSSNQITGWRNSQEDRYVCLPNFYEDFSLFAVYDGHGGEEVVHYLERSLHQFIYRELELTKDIELALYLSFLNCDSSLRSISEAEYISITNNLDQEFEVPERAGRRRFLFGLNNAAGPSGENENQADRRAKFVSACLKDLPSVKYLAQATVPESDHSDDDYQPGDKDINFISKEMNSEEISGSTTESSGDHSTDTLDEEKGCTVEKPKDQKEEQDSEEEQDCHKEIVMNGGSTATVLLMNQKKIFIAHVGDSKCVACVKGKAVDLTQDHRPTDKDELSRILTAGGTISADGRINGDIDMSRAFGDFRYKSSNDVEPFQVLSVEPSISSFEISPELEFIMIASDGIWNTMDSCHVVDYIRSRISDPNLELQDLCGELFEELLPEKETSDGSGCDNMTAIIINFKSFPEISQNTCCIQEVFQYRYPFDKHNESSIEENMEQVEKNFEVNLNDKVNEEKNLMNLNSETSVKLQEPELITISSSDDNESESGEDKLQSGCEMEFQGSPKPSKDIKCIQHNEAQLEGEGNNEDDMEVESPNSPENIDIDEDHEENLDDMNNERNSNASQCGSECSSFTHSHSSRSSIHGSYLSGYSTETTVERNEAIPTYQAYRFPPHYSAPHMCASYTNYPGPSTSTSVTKNPMLEIQDFDDEYFMQFPLRIVNSISSIENAMNHLISELCVIKELACAEIQRFNASQASRQHIQNHGDSTVEQPQSQVNYEVIDISEDAKENELSAEHDKILSKDDAGIEMESNLHVADETMQNAEKSVEIDETDPLIQSPTMQMEANYIDLPSNARENVEGSGNLANEKMHDEKEEIVSQVNMATESPTKQIEANSVQLTNRDIQCPGHSVEKNNIEGNKIDLRSQQGPAVRIINDREKTSMLSGIKPTEKEH